MANAIELSGVTYTFGEHRAVDDLDLEIEAGECFGLLGPNGAGKTTTIRLINTLLPLQQGSIRVFGFDVHRQAMAVRRRIGTSTNLWLDFGVLLGSCLLGICTAAALLGRLAR